MKYVFFKTEKRPTRQVGLTFGFADNPVLFSSFALLPILLLSVSLISRCVRWLVVVDPISFCGSSNAPLALPATDRFGNRCRRVWHSI